jgi:hypothetical protein
MVLLVAGGWLLVARHWYLASGIWYLFKDVIEKSITKKGVKK